MIQFWFTYVFVPKIAEDVLVVSWVSNKPSFEKGDVKNGGIEVDELEEKHFESEVVVKLGLCTVHLCKAKSKKCIIIEYGRG